jgi:hypothetical protein
MPTDIEQMEADLSRIVVTGAIAHAENILILLRLHEAAGTPHDETIRAIYREVHTEVA